MGEVWCRARDEDGVVVDHAVEGFGVDFKRGGVDGDVMDLDAEVGAGFVEGGVDCNGDHPVVTMSTTRSIMRWGKGEGEGVHLWLSNTPFMVRFIPSGKTCHQD